MTYNVLSLYTTAATACTTVGVREQVGHAAPRQGATPSRREEPQVRLVPQVFPDFSAADTALAGAHQRAQIPVPLLRQVV